MTKFALALGIALAAILPTTTLSTKTWAGSDSHSRLAAPFSPKATIYRPDCWTMEDPFNLCDAVGGRIR
jgi:hypothetical protein